MLWIEKYHPEKLTDILGQDPVIHYLSSFAASEKRPPFDSIRTAWIREKCCN